MEDILKYENRDQLYKFLLDDFGFIIIEEQYDFGNFLITLSNNEILIKYIKDRSFLSIDIANERFPSESIDLSFVRDYINNTYETNEEIKKLTNTVRIELLNNFLKEDFYKISELFNNQNYSDNRKKIGEYLKKKFIDQYGL